MSTTKVKTIEAYRGIKDTIMYSTPPGKAACELDSARTNVLFNRLVDANMVALVYLADDSGEPGSDYGIVGMFRELPADNSIHGDFVSERQTDWGMIGDSVWGFAGDPCHGQGGYEYDVMSETISSLRKFMRNRKRPDGQCRCCNQSKYRLAGR